MRCRTSVILRRLCADQLRSRLFQTSQARRWFDVLTPNLLAKLDPSGCLGAGGAVTRGCREADCMPHFSSGSDDERSCSHLDSAWLSEAFSAVQIQYIVSLWVLAGHVVGNALALRKVSSPVPWRSRRSRLLRSLWAGSSRRRRRRTPCARWHRLGLWLLEEPRVEAEPMVDAPIWMLKVPLSKARTSQMSSSTVCPRMTQLLNFD